MSLRRNHTGFSLVELLVIITVVGVLFTSFASFFTNYLTLYSKYQKDALNFSELAMQSQRIAEVVRGFADIIDPQANELTAYAYFSPGDTYTSQIRYYLNPSKTTLLADVIPMTANPPTGTLITNKKKTYTIISDFYQPPGTSLFVYTDISGTTLTPPVSDQHSIVGIQINLASPGSHTKDGLTMNTSVSLRNRKTNL